jgi:pyridoxamine 5'-phosphate oxidase
MSQNKTPENIAVIEHEIWQQLLRASVDKHHEWRSPVLVTNGLADNEKDAWPEARTVILRAVNFNKKELTFYTDSRSPKVAQLIANPKAVIVFWSKRLNWQLRLKVNIEVRTEGELVQKTWVIVKQSPSAGDYLSIKSPGELLNSSPIALPQNSQKQAHFAMIIANVIDIDWLTLSRNGHQRVKIDASGLNHLQP